MFARRLVCSGTRPSQVPFDAGDFRTAETAAAGDLDAFGTKAQRRLHRALHRTAEGNTADKLVGNALSDELRIDFRLADLDDVQLHVAAGHSWQASSEALSMSAPILADDDARTAAA